MKQNVILALFLAVVTLLCSCGGENQSAEQSGVISETASAEQSETASAEQSETASTEQSETASTEQSEAQSESTESASSAEEEILYSGVDGNISWEVKGGTLTLRGNGAMNDYVLSELEETEGMGKRAPWIIIEDSMEYPLNVKKVVIEEGITYIGESAFSYFHFDEISLPSTLTKIGNCAFFGDYSLGEIDIPDSVTEIGISAFGGCWELDVLKFPKSLKKIGSTAFDCCYSLDNFVLPEGLEIIENGAFEECSGLTEVLIPANVKVIEDNAFWHCYNIKTFKVAEENKNYIVEDGVLFSADKKTLIAFPPADGREKYAIPEGIERIGGGSFGYCKNLKEIVIPKTTKIIGNYAFTRCEFAHITIPDGIEEIGNSVFSKCANLETVVFPDSVKVIGGGIFNECESLKSVTLPSDIKIIPSSFLYSNLNVEEITLPSSVEKIEAYAFSFVDNLKKINFDGTEEEWNKIEKEEDWFRTEGEKPTIIFLK